ncbi:hypothetical protein FQA39_LY13685 [Lamprigera yunnana]|nr:hypothetical protein FQA39_LY13685 [Lamprigera yunnana]
MSSNKLSESSKKPFLNSGSEWVLEEESLFSDEVPVQTKIVKQKNNSMKVTNFFVINRERSNCDVIYASDSIKNGTITSPLYPSPYPARTICRYEFQGKGKERVQVVFQEFNLYHPKDDNKELVAYFDFNKGLNAYKQGSPWPKFISDIKGFNVKDVFFNIKKRQNVLAR